MWGRKIDLGACRFLSFLACFTIFHWPNWCFDWSPWYLLSYWSWIWPFLEKYWLVVYCDLVFKISFFLAFLVSRKLRTSETSYNYFLT